MLKVIRDQIADLETSYINQANVMLEKALIEVLRYWAANFPSRRLEHYSGMGTAGFHCESLSIDISDMIDSERKQKFIYSEKLERLFSPLIEFDELFWSLDNYKYPAISRGLYNPVTRTIEVGQKIIQLPSVNIKNVR